MSICVFRHCVTANLRQYESCNNQTTDALDAYARAAELDPSNQHIKARLQLLRSGGGAAGNQHNAPAPQDVHPQAYQTGVGVPPNPGWGGSSGQSQQQPAQPPLDAARVSEWTRGIPAINQPNGPASQQNGFENREGMRAPPMRAPSPRHEPGRPFPEPSRRTPGPGPMRKQSPSPKLQPAGPSGFPTPQTLPQLNLQDRPPPFNGGVRPSPTLNGAPGPQQNGPTANTLPPYGRPFSPPSEIRPIRDDHVNSPPSAGFPQSQYPGPGQPFPSIANGVSSAPQPLPQTAEAPREENRPPSAMKRSREWEADTGPSKKPANEETRARLDEPPRHGSPPNRNATPGSHFRRSSSEVRRENERRAAENYHPSEAAHHPYSLAPQMPPIQTTAEPPREDRKEAVEAAARKMDVDEDYDNNSEDDKRAGSGTAPGTATKNSPVQSAAANGIPKQETAT
jgi:general transcriptional corepressor CYC8